MLRTIVCSRHWSDEKYSGARKLTQAMVQELIDKVVVTDLEHVEIVWKFKDEVRKFIEI